MIKRISIIILSVLILIGCNSDDDETMNSNSDGDMQSIIVDGIQRKYILYVPNSYNESTPTPLLFNFHGFTITAEMQMNNISDMRSIAESENFILVYPQGSLLLGVTHWNVGAWTSGSTSDDVGFIKDLIKKLSTEFNINQNRIYACGHSNGGSFCYELACKLSDRIAAIGAVSATMTDFTNNSCNPSRPISIVSIHGTNDNIVPYNGTNSGMMGQEDIISYWVNHNNTDSTASLQNISNNNGTAEHYTYSNGDNGTRLEHYKIISGGHEWPSAEGTSDKSVINANTIVWNFISQFEL